MSRTSAARRSRAIASQRSEYRPSQKRFSPTRDGICTPPRATSAIPTLRRAGEAAGAGPSDSTHVSLLDPPHWSDTTSRSIGATRVSAPGITLYPSGVATAKTRIAMDRPVKDVASPGARAGARERWTHSCAT